MNFEKPRGLRQSMSWLHTWASLPLGWLLMLVYVSGSLSYFQDEITLWMQPELQQGQSTQINYAKTLDTLSQVAKGASSWSIILPNERNPVTVISWRKPESEHSQNANPRQEGGRGRGGQEQALLDPQSGQILNPRQTAGGRFLYSLHFQLYAIDRFWGRWIVGVATMFMFVAIVSGVIVHRNIFKDFFTFRPGKGKRSWLDGHNATGVFSLPFHVLIMLSGLLLLGAQLIPTAAGLAYQGDGRAFMMDSRGSVSTSAAERTPRGEGRPAVAATLVNLEAVTTAAEAQWNGLRPGQVVISAPETDRARILVSPKWHDDLAGNGKPPKVEFDGVTGRMTSTNAASSNSQSVTRSAWNTLTNLHLGRSLHSLPRWLLFLSGVLGSVMVASGLVMWVVARQPIRPRNAQRPTPFGHRLVGALNVAAIAGLLLSIACYFWANRLIPAQLEGRSEWEISVFFYVWLASLIHAAISPTNQRWTQQLFVSGLLFCGIPVLNALSGGAHLAKSIASGLWQVAAFDSSALLVGAALLFAAKMVSRHQTTASKIKGDIMPAVEVAE